MKTHQICFLLTIALGIFIIQSCTKETESSGILPVGKVDINSPDIDEELGEELEGVTEIRKAANDYAIANSLLHEVIFTTFNQAILNPNFLGLRNTPVVDNRSACPMTTFLPDTGNGDTLVIDFGAGCTIPNGSGDGPTAAGKILLISFGSLNTNFNQFIWFDTVTINGYEIIHNFGTGSSGLKFNNVLPTNSPPYTYRFEGKVPDLTSFVVTAPNGDVTTLVPEYSPTPFTIVEIVDNDPPLTLDWMDFLDAHYEIEIGDTQVSNFRTDGTTHVFVAKDIPGEPIIYDPPCRWFQEGKMEFTGTLNQTIDYGVDLDSMNMPVAGMNCDGVVKITDASGSCRVVICP